MELFRFLDVDLLLKIVLGVIMLSVGLSLRLQDFHYVLQHRRLLGLGLVLKLLLLPLLGYLVLSATELSMIFKFGTMILLFSAGGTTSNVITYWFAGTSALTIFLTTISSLLAVFLIPILVNLTSFLYFGSGTEFSLPVLETVLNIIVIIIVPTLVGLYIHERFETLARRLEKVLKPSSVVMLGLVFLIKFFAPADAGGTGISWADISQLLPTLVLINLVGMIAGFFLCKRLSLNSRDSMTIGIEMGLQNAGMAILIGGVFLGNEELVKPALLYAMFTFWSTAIFAWVIKRRYYEKSWT